MRRTLVLAAGAACLAMAAGAHAQPSFTAEQLVAKNLEARGGAARLQALNNVRFSGRVIFPGGFEMTAVQLLAKDGMRQEASIQGLTVINAYDGRVGWKVNPFQGRRDAEQMSGDEARQLADSGLVEGVLLASRGDGSTVAYQGIEDVDGTPSHKLLVTQKDGDQFTYYLDPDTFLEIKVIETRRVRGAEQVTESELGDYEKVGDVYFPMAISSGPQGSNQRQNITIEKAEANVTVQPGYFAMPGAPAAK
jgi:hypothetical protein